MPGNSGNARDNRQRGNAAQLHEKYKNMARDAQLAGDRVQSEYYLQFADHYFRVLGESRSRYEEQRRQRGEDMADDEDDYDSPENDGEGDDEQPQRRTERTERPERSERRERPERPERSDEPRRGRANGRQRDRAADDENGDERIAFDALPPAIAAESAADSERGEEERPRRRTRRSQPPAGDGEGAASA